ncbi:MAG: hypothetical protein RLZZ70_73 [Candidatus Parcubacteria bacterium]|jgi:uncharacterized membrane protein (UPF0127 family)
MVWSRNWFLLLGALVLIGSWYWYTEQKATASLNIEETPRTYYAPLIPMRLGNIDVFASVADTSATRTLGLSRTSSLPVDVIKLFVFETPGRYTFWMKEMLYPIDMVWLDTTGKIVHIETAVRPESYPQTYGPEVATQYVIETNVGFFATTGLEVGDTIILPTLD